MVKVSPAQLQDRLEGLDYPASKNDLKQHARDKGADQEVLNLIDQLSERIITLLLILLTRLVT